VCLILYSDGTLSDVDRELFIKPCTPAEIAFYESSIADHPDFAALMPTFMGSLTLTTHQNGTLQEQGAALIAEQKPSGPVTPSKRGTKKIITNMAIVLENAAAGFKRPNILDVKLGVRLWADDAAQDKKTRFDLVTEQTTHKTFGFRIAGMRVWQGENAKSDQFEIDDEGYRIFDKDYGRYIINNDNIADAFKEFMFTESAGIDIELGKSVAQAFTADLQEIQKTLENQESRMYSASLLFVFEGDGAALRAAMEEASRPLAIHTSGINGHGVVNGDEDEDEEDTIPKIYSVKVIDFAHAQWVPGMGPDENALLGVRSVIKVLKELGQDP
jgi:1D-myo-inositol-tetrakisphosphate 5-kinase/inositol-polyphosphate multikinase